MPAPLWPPPEARAPPSLPPPEPLSLLRDRLIRATRALAVSFENGAAASDAIAAARLLSRAATTAANAFASSSSSSPTDESSNSRLHALQCSLGDAIELLNVAAHANPSPSSSSSSFAVAGAALLLAGCSASAAAGAPGVNASAAEAATQALLRMAANMQSRAPMFSDREAAGDAAAGVGRLAAAAAAAAALSPAPSAATAAATAAAAAAALLLAFARLAAAAAAAASPPLPPEGEFSVILLPVSHAARMAASAAPPAALGPLLAEAATRAGGAAAAAAEASGSSPSLALVGASFAFLLAGLAEGAGPRSMPGSLPRELLGEIWGACGRAAARGRDPGNRNRLVERDAAAAAAVAVAESSSSSGNALFPPQASSAMSSVLVSLICEGGGPLDFTFLFEAAAARSPPEIVAAKLLLQSENGGSNSGSFFPPLARSLAPRAARALAIVVPSCPRGEAARCLEGVAAAARRLHEGYASLAADGGSAENSGAASWLSSPALAGSGALRGALDAAFMSCVAALRALAVPAGALAGSNGSGSCLPSPSLPPPEPRAAAAALDALALVSFARPPEALIQAHSDLVSGLIEAAGAEVDAGSPFRGSSVGVALVERIPPYEFFFSPSPPPSSPAAASSPPPPPRWVADALLATRAHFYLLCLAPAARGMSLQSSRGGGGGGEASAATQAAASLALLFLGHPTSPALRGAAHGLAAALMDRGGPLSAPGSGGRGRGGSDAAPPLLLLPGFLDRALDVRGGVRPHHPGLSIAVAAALRGCSGEEGSEAAASASLLVPRRLSAALRESLLSFSSPAAAAAVANSNSDGSSLPSQLPSLPPESLALVSALASALLSVDAGGFSDACAVVEGALSPNPAVAAAAANAAPFSSPLPSGLPLPLPLSAAAFDALGRAIGSTDDLLRKPALARWWARAAAGVGVAAGR